MKPAVTALLGSAATFLLAFISPAIDPSGGPIEISLGITAMAAAAITAIIVAHSVSKPLVAMLTGAVAGILAGVLLAYGPYFAYLSGVRGLHISSYGGDYDSHLYPLLVLPVFVVPALAAGTFLGLIGWASRVLIRRWV